MGKRQFSKRTRDYQHTHRHVTQIASTRTPRLAAEAAPAEPARDPRGWMFRPVRSRAHDLQFAQAISEMTARLDDKRVNYRPKIGATALTLIYTREIEALAGDMTDQAKVDDVLSRLRRIDDERLRLPSEARVTGLHRAGPYFAMLVDYEPYQAERQIICETLGAESATLRQLPPHISIAKIYGPTHTAIVKYDQGVADEVYKTALEGLTIPLEPAIVGRNFTN